jgi:hypothetical protein
MHIPTPPIQRILTPMHLLETLAAAFINTFGITQPTDKTRRLAAFFILGMLLLVILGLAALAALILRLM